MEGMREIARSYYERASEDEQISIIQSFANLDVDGDGKISLVEFKKSVSSWLSAEAVFEKLDENGDGSLDFEEFLCLHYMEKKVDIARCSGCWELLVGPYFSCLLCFGRGEGTYDLCCACYRRGSCLSHEHEVQHMMDHHSLLMLFRNRTAAAEKSQNKKEMEEIREIAKALHRGSSPQVQELATEFYQAMDSDGDGRVDLSEFLAFMMEVGYSYEKTPTLFDELDVDSNGTLDFIEVMTLLYILKSGRPQCDCCEKIIPGVFFSCVECFKNPKTSFDLCKDCYMKGRCDHEHGGRAQFLDSHTLLQAMRYPEIADISGITIHEAENRSTDVSGVTIHEAGNRSTYDIVPSNSKWRKRKAAYYALDTAVKFGTISTFSFCTIM